MKILFICGSMNQTTMMHKIAHHLSDHECWFTPYYTDGIIGVLERKNLIEFTVAGSIIQRRVLTYCATHDLAVDERAASRTYDLVVTCSDLIIPKNIRGTKIVLVQEGMTDPENFAYYLVKYLGLPRYIASTSTTGMSDAYVRFCVASEGYREHFVRKGVRDSKIVVTGIPNFDNCASFRKEPFEHRGFTLVATSDARETFKYENRKKFIEKCLRLANGSQLIFKLHPNELVERASAEIRLWAPDALIYHNRPIEPMIAHCDTLITKYSTVVYIGIALGKVVHSDFDMATLRRMMPVQNEGTSAETIAGVCREVLRRPIIHVGTRKVFA